MHYLLFPLHPSGCWLNRKEKRAWGFRRKQTKCNISVLPFVFLWRNSSLRCFDLRPQNYSWKKKFRRENSIRSLLKYSLNNRIRVQDKCFSRLDSLWLTGLKLSCTLYVKFKSEYRKWCGIDMSHCRSRRYFTFFPLKDRALSLSNTHNK